MEIRKAIKLIRDNLLEEEECIGCKISEHVEMLEALECAYDDVIERMEALDEIEKMFSLKVVK